MPTALFTAIVLLIALVDSTLKASPAYIPVNITLRVLVLLPLIFRVAVGPSTTARLRIPQISAEPNISARPPTCQPAPSGWSAPAGAAHARRPRADRRLPLPRAA